MCTQVAVLKQQLLRCVPARLQVFYVLVAPRQVECDQQASGRMRYGYRRKQPCKPLSRGRLRNGAEPEPTPAERPTWLCRHRPPPTLAKQTPVDRAGVTHPVQGVTAGSWSAGTRGLGERHQRNRHNKPPAGPVLQAAKRRVKGRRRGWLGAAQRQEGGQGDGQRLRRLRDPPVIARGARGAQ